MIDIIRALVRPFIAVSTWGVVVALAVIFSLKYGDVTMADKVLTFVLATGATIAGFYFGERAAKK